MFKKDGNNEIKTLSHSTYRCQYHIVYLLYLNTKKVTTTIQNIYVH